MSEQNKSVEKNINDILNAMNRANEAFSYEIWIPSLQKDVMFREVSTSQQKRLVKSIIDSPIYNTEFIFTITQIIKENCVDNIDINNFTILDKLFICLKTRATSINDTYEFEFEKFGAVHKRGLSIEGIYEKAKAINFEKIFPQIFNDSVYKIECAMPTIHTEYIYEKEFRNKSENIDIKTTAAMRDAVGEMFMGEIIKFINKVTIKISEEEEMVVDFNDSINFKSRLSILEQIPMKLIDKIITYITEIKEEIQQVILIETSVKDENGENQQIKEALTIDGRFFINS